MVPWVGWPVEGGEEEEVEEEEATAIKLISTRVGTVYGRRLS